MTKEDEQQKPTKLADTIANVTSHPFLRSWIVWACAAVFYGYQFMLRISPSIMADDLMRNFNVDASELGVLTSFYYIGYAALQIPLGVLMDRYGPRRILTAASLLASIGCLVFSMTDDLYLASIGRLMIGMGSAAGFISCVKLATMWFPAERMSFIVGMTMMLGTSGALIAGVPLAHFVENYGWRASLWISAALGLVLSYAIFTIIRDTPPATHPMSGQAHTAKEPDNFKTILQNVAQVLKSRQTWLIGLYGGFIYVPLSGFADMWGVPFFIQVHKLDVPVAASLISFFYVGMGLGAPLYSFVIQRFRSYRKTLLLTSVGSGILLTIVFYMPGLPVFLMQAILFVAGALISGQFLAFALTCTINPHHLGGTVSGAHNMICMSSGIILQPVIGMILDYNGDGSMINGVPYFSNENYFIAMSAVPFCVLISIVLTFFIVDPLRSRKVYA